MRHVVIERVFATQEEAQALQRMLTSVGVRLNYDVTRSTKEPSKFVMVGTPVECDGCPGSESR